MLLNKLALLMKSNMPSHLFNLTSDTHRSLNLNVTLILMYTGYWLLLRGVIIQSVPMHCCHFINHFASCASSNRSSFIHQSSVVTAEIPSSEAGSWREMPLNLVDVTSL
jgi:hypothetical protein